MINFMYNYKRKKNLAIDSEGTINFAPTYKFVPDSNNYLNEEGNKRIPSYTDRILFCINKLCEK